MLWSSMHTKFEMHITLGFHPARENSNTCQHAKKKKKKKMEQSQCTELLADYQSRHQDNSLYMCTCTYSHKCLLNFALTSWYHSVAKTLDYVNTTGDIVLDQSKVRYTSTNTKIGIFWLKIIF